MNLFRVALFYFIVNIATCLKNVRVIFPKSVPEGGVATLYCLYDLEGESLLSVKWYRGNREIFRYLPNEKPRIKIFLIPGLHIDITSSNAHCLALTEIPKHLGGNFTCEITEESPGYSTQYVTDLLNVVVNNSSENYEEVPHGSYTHSSVKGNNSNLDVNNGSEAIRCVYCFLIIILQLLIKYICPQPA